MKKKHKQVLLVALALIIAALLVWLLLRARHPKKVPINGSPVTTQHETRTGAATDKGLATANSDVPGGNTGQNAPAAPVLQAPSGTFVSNHRPSLTGSPGPLLNSVCITNSGATCWIEFTKDGVVKALAQKVADKDGVANWNSWKLQDYGLTEGSWTIRAVATLNGQQQATTDNVKLEIQP